MSDLTTANLKQLLDESTPGPWEYLTHDYCPDRYTQDECDQMGAAYPKSMTFECGCGDEQEDCQTQHYITGKTDGVIAWNPQFNEMPSTDDMHLAALAPELAQEVIRLRAHINGIIYAMDTKARTGEKQDPATIAGYLKEIILGESNE